MKTFKKSFSFIDATRKRARIEAEITNRNKYPEFTVSGSYDNECGQCLDHIQPRTHSQKLFIDLWREYHLKNITDIPPNVQFWPDFTGHLTGIIEEIEKEEKEREEAKEEKTGDERILEIMEEEGIDEVQLDAVKAYIEAMGIEDLKDFNESYAGQYPSDEEFAKEQAKQYGEIPKKNHWPHYCIDWEYAARELMMDYTEQDGFYFRNL